MEEYFRYINVLSIQLKFIFFYNVLVVTVSNFICQVT